MWSRRGVLTGHCAGISGHSESWGKPADKPGASALLRMVVRRLSPLGHYFFASGVHGTWSIPIKPPFRKPQMRELRQSEQLFHHQVIHGVWFSTCGPGLKLYRNSHREVQRFWYWVLIQRHSGENLLLVDVCIVANWEVMCWECHTFYNWGQVGWIVDRSLIAIKILCFTLVIFNLWLISESFC